VPASPPVHRWVHRNVPAPRGRWGMQGWGGLAARRIHLPVPGPHSRWQRVRT
jgi:hypothetical protein